MEIERNSHTELVIMLSEKKQCTTTRTIRKFQLIQLRTITSYVIDIEREFTSECIELCRL